MWTANDGSVTLLDIDDPNTVDSDEQLMLAYRNGNCDAFDRLYNRHGGHLFRFILRQVGRRDIAEELFQDVWMRLIDSRHRYRVRARFQTFLYRIARNRIIDHYRSDRWTPLEAPDQIPADEPSAADRLDDERATELLASALATLPPAQRSAVALRLDQDLGLHQIATICGCGRETIKSRLRYAYRRLRKILGEHNEC